MQYQESYTILQRMKHGWSQGNNFLFFPVAVFFLMMNLLIFRRPWTPLKLELIKCKPKYRTHYHLPVTTSLVAKNLRENLKESRHKSLTAAIFPKATEKYLHSFHTEIVNISLFSNSLLFFSQASQCQKNVKEFISAATGSSNRRFKGPKRSCSFKLSCAAPAAPPCCPSEKSHSTCDKLGVYLSHPQAADLSSCFRICSTATSFKTAAVWLITPFLPWQSIAGFSPIPDPTNFFYTFGWLFLFAESFCREKCKQEKVLVPDWNSEGNNVY